MSENTRETKKTLRDELMAREAALSPEYTTESNRGICQNVLALPEFQAAGAVLLFYSIWAEPNTHPIINAALEQGKTVTLPESLPNGIMVARQIKSLAELVPARYNIPSPTGNMPEIPPEELDFILVPSVAFDLEGYRLGHGGGYYDRYMPRTPAFRCGIAREQMLLPRVPRGFYDVAVNAIVTEEKIIRID